MSSFHAPRALSHGSRNIIELNAIAREAAALAAKLQPAALPQVVGGPQSDELIPSTAAEVHTNLSSQLGDLQPRFPLVSQESESPSLRIGSYRVCAPICGVHSYLTKGVGNDRWGTMVGEIVDGVALAGVMIMPKQKIAVKVDGRFFDAQISREYDSAAHAKENGDRCNAWARMLSRPDSPDPFVLFPSRFYQPEATHGLRDVARRFNLGIISVDSSAEATWLMLTGKASLFVAPHGRVWEMAVVAAAIRTVGGGTFSLGGEPLLWQKPTTGCCLSWDPSLGRKFALHMRSVQNKFSVKSAPLARPATSNTLRASTLPTAARSSIQTSTK